MNIVSDRHNSEYTVIRQEVTLVIENIEPVPRALVNMIAHTHFKSSLLHTLIFTLPAIFTTPRQIYRILLKRTIKNIKLC